jgi:3-deoxy-D-manno-octulosonic-acid transferase
MLKNIIIKIYNLVIMALLPFLFIRLLVKSLKSKPYRLRLAERLGIFKAPNFKDSIWVHAVSVGEIIAATPIIQKIQEKLAGQNIVVTCTTPAGSYMANKLFGKFNNILHVYFPFDVNFAINNFFKKTKPKLLIILEKEIWPNLIVNCSNNNIPIIIANAQMSNRSFRRYGLVRPLIAWILQKIAFISAQTKFDAYKFKKFLGNKLDIIAINGNTKFDSVIQNIKSNITTITRPTWIAASTHPGEEELIIKAHQIILNTIPDVLLILAPRHIERCSNIVNIIKNNSQDINISIRSQQSIKIPEGHVYLADSLGELNLLYSMSNVAFVGGSLVPFIGGHNVLEPAALSVPIIVGPYTANCKQIVTKLELARGLFVVKNHEELAEIIIKLLNNNNLREQIGANSRNFLYKQTGASDKIVDKCLELCVN